MTNADALLLVSLFVLTLAIAGLWADAPERRDALRRNQARRIR